MELGDCASISLAKIPELLSAEHKTEGLWTEEGTTGTAEEVCVVQIFRGLIRPLHGEC